MSNLFSHAEPSQQDLTFCQLPTLDDNTGRPAVIVVVPVEVDRAWKGFTEYIHLWWPAEFTTFGLGTHVELTGELVVEEGEDGAHLDWARITAAERPLRLELTWVLGRDPLAPARVVIDFTDMGAGEAVRPPTNAVVGTRVSLTEEDPGRAGVADSALQYPGGVRGPGQLPGWHVVLERYARFMGSPLRGVSAS